MSFDYDAEGKAVPCPCEDFVLPQLERKEEVKP